MANRRARAMLHLVMWTILVFAGGVGALEWVQRGGDAVLYTSILDTVFSSSAAQCGVLCFNRAGCRGFDFSRSTQECVLHDAGAITAATPASVSRSNEKWQNFGLPTSMKCSAETCLMYVNTAMTWAAASAHCRNLGLHLVVYNTNTERDFARTIYSSNTWTGARDQVQEGYWFHEDGSTGTISLWCSTEPNGGTNENCMEINSAGCFNDLPCSGIRTFFCEY